MTKVVGKCTTQNLLKSFGGILLEKLSKIELNDETFTDYIIGILSDETVENSEKYEIISEFLMDASEKSTDSLVKEIIDSWEAWSEKMKIYKEEERLAQLELEAKEKKILELKKLEQDSEITQQSLSSSSSSSPTTLSLRETKTKQLTKEERKKREQLLAKYSYDFDEIVENEDDVVKDEERMRREEMQKKHEFEKERNRFE
nr:15947_t:CDS:2 [Entrophospora candida]